MKQIIEGYKNFKQDYFNKNREFFNNLIEEGQKPQTLVIACSDSRVDPAIVTKAVPGELFVIRNVANLVPPYSDIKNLGYHGTSAALEFGVCHLKVKNIIVFGHSKCGGMQSLFDETPKQKESFLATWLDMAKPVFQEVNKNYPQYDNHTKADICSKLSLIQSIANLQTFPWIDERVKEQTLSLHGWYFDIQNCTTAAWDGKNGFIDLV
jgi:carbonic anhydrase